jgi:pimeloyl-ACP methyl ester carboxylesterase
LAPPPRRAAALLRDLRGSAKLAIDSVQGVTGIVETMHRRIARLSPPLGAIRDAPMGGITGFVYRRVRGTTSFVGKALDAALAAAESIAASTSPAHGSDAASPAADAFVSALNGVVGDHLERTGNPLAIAMQLKERKAHAAGGRVLLLVHGLCMTDSQWTRSGHDHGEALARSLEYSPVYARYNTGRHVSANGRELAIELERWAAARPAAMDQLAIIGHSMGGLVARSALHHAIEARMEWPCRVRQLVFLGTPHHGAPLEKAGNWVHAALGVSPYAEPFARLSGLRSAGITDLRFGNLLEADWSHDRFAHRDSRHATPLPHGVACYAVAGSLESAAANAIAGDGLVTVASALGRHDKATRDLRIPASNTWVARGVGHLDLLGSAAVYRRYRRIHRWLKAS